MAHILIVDDEKPVRDVLSQLLERQGHEVMTAVNGAEAVGLFNENAFDLVVTDLLMPEKDGLEMIIELTENRPDLKIIAISGGGATGKLDFLPAAKHLGAAKILKKPFAMKELADAVEELLMK